MINIKPGILCLMWSVVTSEWLFQFFLLLDILLPIFYSRDMSSNQFLSCCCICTAMLNTWLLLSKQSALSQHLLSICSAWQMAIFARLRVSCSYVCSERLLAVYLCNWLQRFSEKLVLVPTVKVIFVVLTNLDTSSLPHQFLGMDWSASNSET